MILKGNQRAGGDDLATHLLNLYDNDEIALAEVRGTIADDLHGAFAEFEAMATGTRAQEALYSLSINPSEPLTRAQYKLAIERIEEHLGLSGQPRAVVFHEKGGRAHCHVVWSRIDVDAMKAIPLSHDRQKLRTMAQVLGYTFGHQLPDGLKHDRGAARHGAGHGVSVAEQAQGEAAGLPADQRKQDITAAYREARDAQGFIDGLWERGYHLARGDKRGFVVVDAAGGVHSLSRQVEGAKAKDIKALLSPLTPEDLPGVKETRKRIADLADSRALDEGPRAALRRSPEELKARQADRRAGVMALWQKAELAQRAERLALHEAQKREQDRPFARAARVVLGLFEKVPVLHTVLSRISVKAGLSLEERHRLEREALERRYERERKTLDRQLAALSRIEHRENRSLARDQRRLKGEDYERARQQQDELLAFRENADSLTRQRKAETPKPETPKPETPAPRKRRPRGFGMRP